MSIRLLRGSLKWIWILTGNSPQPRRVKWKGGSLRTDTVTKSHMTSLQHKVGRKKKNSKQDVSGWKNKQNVTAHPLWVMTLLIISLNQSRSLWSFWLPAFGRARVCACISHSYSSRPYQWCVVSLVFIHPSICIQAVSKSEQGGVNARVSQEELMSACYGKVRGIFAETSKRQQFKKCWLIKEIIYSEATGSLKSLTTIKRI